MATPDTPSPLPSADAELAEAAASLDAVGRCGTPVVRHERVARARLTAGPVKATEAAETAPTAGQSQDSTLDSGAPQPLPNMEVLNPSPANGYRRHDAPAGNDVHHPRRSRRYGESAGRDDHLADPARDVVVATPTEPPRLNPTAARALLRILTKAAPTGKAPP